MKLQLVARMLRKEHRKLKSWPAVGKIHGLTAAMAWKIANQNYDPADPEIRSRLELGPRPCPTCHRKSTVPREDRPAPRHGKFGWMIDLKSDELLSLLEGREVMA